MHTHSVSIPHVLNHLPPFILVELSSTKCRNATNLKISGDGEFTWDIEEKWKDEKEKIARREERKTNKRNSMGQGKKGKCKEEKEKDGSGLKTNNVGKVEDANNDIQKAYVKVDGNDNNNATTTNHNNNSNNVNNEDKSFT